jgi:hypothetical protein
MDSFIDEIEKKPDFNSINEKCISIIEKDPNVKSAMKPFDLNLKLFKFMISALIRVKQSNINSFYNNSGKDTIVKYEDLFHFVLNLNDFSFNINDSNLTCFAKYDKPNIHNCNCTDLGFNFNDKLNLLLKKHVYPWFKWCFHYTYEVPIDTYKGLSIRTNYIMLLVIDNNSYVIYNKEYSQSFDGTLYYGYHTKCKCDNKLRYYYFPEYCRKCNLKHDIIFTQELVETIINSEVDPVKIIDIFKTKYFDFMPNLTNLNLAYEYFEREKELFSIYQHDKLKELEKRENELVMKENKLRRLMIKHDSLLDFDKFLKDNDFNL